MSAAIRFGIIAIAGALGAAGSYLLATSSLFDAAPERAPSAATEISIPPANTDEIHNSTYGFSFHYPREWGTGPFHDRRVRQSVGRRDGVFCYVSIMEHRFAAGESGTPQYLAAEMRSLSTRHLERQIKGARIRADRFEKSALGGQEARAFTVDVTGAPEGHLKMTGQVTLRDYGVVFLGCVAPSDRFNDFDVQDAFKTVQRTFRFDGRARPAAERREESSSATPSTAGGFRTAPGALRKQ